MGASTWKQRTRRACAMRASRVDRRKFAGFVVIGVIVVGAVVPAARAAYSADGVFVLDRGFCCLHDVAMLPDGSVLASNLESSASAPTWRLWPDGRRERVSGFDASGLALAPDSSVLGIDGPSNVIRRWVPGERPSVVAGVAADGSEGDGGPALAAPLSLDFETWGILPRPDGGFLFVETGHLRVRAVDRFGVITTVAGPPGVSFEYPTGLGAARDGGFIVSDQDGLYEFHADGSMKILTRAAVARDVESLADGSVLWTDSGGQLRRLAPGAKVPALMMRSGAKRQWDFAARSVNARGLAGTAGGGLVIASDAGVVYMPVGPTAWSLVTSKHGDRPYEAHSGRRDHPAGGLNTRTDAQRPRRPAGAPTRRQRSCHAPDPRATDPALVHPPRHA